MNNSPNAPFFIKIGGALLARPALLEPLWESVRTMLSEQPVCMVHGGGPQATEMAQRLGHQPRIVQGRRVTTDLDLSIMQWTLRGSLNTQLVAQALRHAIPAVGLSGVDGGILQVTKRPPWEIDGEQIDFGWVGDVDRVRVELLARLMETGFLPVVAPLGVDGAGQVYNVNADTVACALAAALQASQFMLVAESGGVLQEVGNPDSLLPVCSRETFDAGIREGWIQGGMRVKLQIAFEALRLGIPEVFILSPDDLLARTQGTQVVG